MEEEIGNRPERKVPLGTLVLFFLFLLLIAAALFFWKPLSTSPPPKELMGVLRPAPKALTDFTLVDHQGVRFGKEQLVGRWSFLFFGYTHCPDVCPATLSLMGQVQKQLIQKKDSLPAQFLFVSVDPLRDSPEVLAEYMGFFEPDFIGLTGETEAIDAFTRQLGAGYVRGDEISPGNYVVNHTSAIFLIDPQARVVAAFSQPHRPEAIVRLFYEIRAYISS